MSIVRLVIMRNPDLGLRSYRRYGWVLATASLLAMLASGCVSGGGRAVSGVPPEELPYLLPPTEGWEGTLAPDRALQLQELYRDLVERGDRLRVLNEAVALLEREPDFFPARVLESEVRYSSGRYSAVVERLTPVRLAVPGYVAAEVLYGRASEHLDRPLEAFEAYWSVRQQSRIASRRVEALREQTLILLSDSFDQQIVDGLDAQATQTFVLLQRYGPGDARTLAAEQRLSEVAADPMARLILLRQLSAEPGVDPEILRRRAELELEVGDSAAAVRLAEGLAAAQPEDRGLAELLQRAQFQWRLNILPAEVVHLAALPQLSRADYAVLLYWLFPGVRYGQPSEARIATDIIDHPQRQKIVRVINLGLLDVDSTVHRFAPGAPIRRTQALRALLDLVDESAEAGACLEPFGGVPRSRQRVCEAAQGCYLLATAEECSPETTLSGAEALEMIRRTLANLDPPA